MLTAQLMRIIALVTKIAAMLHIHMETPNGAKQTKNA
jgi:hypothetical protein